MRVCARAGLSWRAREGGSSRGTRWVSGVCGFKARVGSGDVRMCVCAACASAGSSNARWRRRFAAGSEREGGTSRPPRRETFGAIGVLPLHMSTTRVGVCVLFSALRGIEVEKQKNGRTRARTHTQQIRGKSQRAAAAAAEKGVTTTRKLGCGKKTTKEKRKGKKHQAEKGADAQSSCAAPM